MIKNHPHKSARTALRRLSVFAGLGLTAVSYGAVNVGDVQLGGFFSQGYLKSTENNFPIDTKDGTADFREMGLNGSTNLTSKLRLSGQLFAQTLGKYGHDKVQLDWAVLDYNFRPEFGLQVGRLKYPRSLNSDVLDLDVVRPFIFLPQGIYDARMRDFQKSFDGAMAYGSVGVGSSTFDYKVYAGKLPFRPDSGVADFFNTTGFYAPSGVTSIDAKRIYGASLIWGTPLPGLRFGVTYSRIPEVVGTGPFRFAPTFAADIRLAGLDYKNAFVEYTRGPWTFTGEYLREHAGDTTLNGPKALGMAPMATVYGADSWYVSVARRLGKAVEVGTYYTATHDADSKSNGPERHRHDWTSAVRFDVTDHLLFKLEVHAIKGTQDIFNVSGIENSAANLKDSMLLFAAKTTISF